MPGGSPCRLVVHNATQAHIATARPSHKAGSRPVQTETWRSGLTHPLAKRATPSRGSAGSNPAVSALEGDPAWRGNGLENRQVRKGRGSTPPPSARYQPRTCDPYAVATPPVQLHNLRRAAYTTGLMARRPAVTRDDPGSSPGWCATQDLRVNTWLFPGGTGWKASSREGRP